MHLLLEFFCSERDRNELGVRSNKRQISAFFFLFLCYVSTAKTKNDTSFETREDEPDQKRLKSPVYFKNHKLLESSKVVG